MTQRKLNRPLGIYRKVTNESVQLALAAYAQGASMAQVGATLGISRNAVYDLFKRRGVVFRPNLRFGAENHFYRGGPREDHNAQGLVWKAIASGKITPKPCETCGDTGEMVDGRNTVQAHHDDYNFPLQVRWLCQVCHHEWHKHNRAVPKKVEGLK